MAASIQRQGAELGSPLGVTTGDVTVADPEKLEEAGEKSFKGSFAARHLLLTSLDGDQCVISFDESRFFAKPSPYRGNLISVGMARVIEGGRFLIQQPMEIRWVDGAARARLAGEGWTRELDDAEMKRFVLILCRLVWPGIDAPRALQHKVKARARDFPARPKLEANGFQVQPGGGPLEVGGEEALKESLRRRLQNSGPKVSTPTSNLFSVLDADARDKQAIVQKVFSEEVSQTLGPFVDSVYRFDATSFGSAPGHVAVELILKPHGSEIVSWKFDLRFSRLGLRLFWQIMGTEKGLAGPSIPSTGKSCGSMPDPCHEDSERRSIGLFAWTRPITRATQLE